VTFQSKDSGTLELKPKLCLRCKGEQFGTYLKGRENPTLDGLKNCAI
jgi:hypothetical protein